MVSTAQQGASSIPTRSPARAGLVLTTLILAALVCNVNLSVANIALSSIGRSFDADQTQLNLVALGCSLGLAMSVLYLGAIGDRHGRKLMLTLGLGLTLPFSFLAAYATSPTMLIIARILTGVAAGMAYPTTLALITALWSEGPQRTRAIALWSSVSGGAAILGPVIAGALLEKFWWGSVFLIAVVPAAIALPLVLWCVPGKAEESTDPIDHLGGVLSVAMVALVVLGVGTIGSPGMSTIALIMIIVAAALIAVFFLWQRRAPYPLFTPRYAARRFFWVPATGGMIVFGAMMGSMFIGQQFLQNVLSYSTFEAGLAVLPAAVGMIAAAPISARLVIRRGARLTMLVGFGCILPGFIVMLLAWREVTAYGWVALAYLLVGVGAGIALTPASRSLTSSVPATKAGMASGTTDLERDLGGSIMQALLGSLLTAGYATAMIAQIGSSSEAASVTEQTRSALQQSYASAANLAAQNPTYATQIVGAARESFLTGANWAYLASIAAVVIGGVVVALCLPGHKKEIADLTAYAEADSGTDAVPAQTGSGRESA